MFVPSYSTVIPILHTLFWAIMVGLMPLKMKWNKKSLPIAFVFIAVMGISGYLIYNSLGFWGQIIAFLLIISLMGRLAIAVILRWLFVKFVSEHITTRHRMIFCMVHLVLVVMIVLTWIYIILIGDTWLTFYLVPILVILWVAMIYSLSARKPKRLIYATFLVFSLSFTVLGIPFAIPLPPPPLALSGLIVPRVDTGVSQLTDDGLFMYRIDTINPRQRITRAVIYAQSMGTGEEVVINLNRRMFGIGRNALYLCRRNLQLEPTDTYGVYMLSMQVYRQPQRSNSLYIWTAEVDFTNGTVYTPQIEPWRGNRPTPSH